jgi:aspartyl-tRNA(Asn)/glutamyl-tRNA(Gln) amidotransferase subunit A
VNLDPDAPFPTLTDLARAYRSGEVTPSRVVGAHLDRLNRLDRHLGAWQAVYSEDAMRLAEAADRMFEAGIDLGPFQGIPFALKDICDVKGRVTTGGSKAMENRISPETGTLTKRLFAAGGIMLGKTKTVECAFGGWGTNLHMGTPRNPWDRETHRVPGGSSSGTGVAVAAGMAVCGVGTDTGGSVRLPAAYCGITGLKVTEGRLPIDGILPLSHSLDTPGPLARSVADARVMFAAMDGSPDAGITGNRGIAGLRLGVPDDVELEVCTAEIRAAFSAALETLRGLGAVLVPFKTPRSLADLTAECGRFIVAEAYAHHHALYDRADLPLDPGGRMRMLVGRGISAVDYVSMQSTRRAGMAKFLTLMSELDAIVTPTTRETAPPVTEIDEADAPSVFTRFANWFGLCALSLPSGVAADGLPTSLQIVGRPHDEAMVMRIGAAYEAERGPFPAPDISAGTHGGTDGR